MYLVNAQPVCHRAGRLRGVAGQHHQLFHALVLQVLQGLGRAGLGGVLNADHTRILAVHRQIHQRTAAFRRGKRRVFVLHQAGIAHGHGFSVHLSLHAQARQLLHIRNPVRVRLQPGRRLNGLGDGVAGVLLRQGRQRQQLGLLPAGLGGHIGHGEVPLGEGAGLVHDHHLGFRQGL